ncbi:MAG: tRNA pseudouridine(38-40) synthase TruA [Bacillota bacterium]
MASPDERTIKLIVAYDGTPYHGFQRQRSGLTTIQSELERAIKEACGERVTVAGAGRTDAGVHALGQVVSFRTKCGVPPDRWPQALASRLPPEIMVTSSGEVPKTFHARFSAKAKTYRYMVLAGPADSPMLARYTARERGPLDLEATRRGAAHLVGRHDFSSFWAAGSPRSSPVRTVEALQVEAVEPRLFLPPGYRSELVVFTVTADGFLYKMVRNFVGTLLEVGLGRSEPDDVKRILESRNRAKAAPTAPPRGLCLVEVRYS